MWKAGHVGEFGHKKQDQLYLTPAPGAFVLGMVGWVKRRINGAEARFRSETE